MWRRLVTRSTTHLSQCRTFMHCDMVGFVALDFILRVVRTGVMCISLIVDVPCMYPNNCAADPSCFRIPGHVVSDFKRLCHYNLSPAFVFLDNLSRTQSCQNTMLRQCCMNPDEGSNACPVVHNSQSQFTHHMPPLNFYLRPGLANSTGSLLGVVLLIIDSIV